MRTVTASALLSVAVGGCFVEPEPEPITPPGGVAALGGGGGGGWDYNSDRWNALGERLPFGRVAPNTITRAQHVLWSLAAGDPPCVGVTDGIEAVGLRGSHREDGAPVGPDVVVTAGGVSAPLAIGASVALAVTVRTEAEPGAAARPGALVLTRVADFHRPPRADEPPTRHLWRQYAATFYPAAACASSIELGVAIVAPAPRFPDGELGYRVGTLPGVFELASTYHGGQVAALLVKAAFNLDLGLALPGEAAAQAGPCGTADVVDNDVAFLAAFGIGNASLVTFASPTEVGALVPGGGRRPPAGEAGAVDAADGLVGPAIAFTTRRGEPIRVAALIQDGATARPICYAADTAPVTGEPAAVAPLAWPADATAELDAVMATGWNPAAGERAADPAGFRLASGLSARRMDAFLAASPLAERFDVAAQVAAHTAATRIGAQAGAVRDWLAVRGVAVGHALTVVTIETMPPEAAAAAYDHPVEQAMASPVCGDGVCGFVAGVVEACVSDCAGVAGGPVALPLEDVALPM